MQHLARVGKRGFRHITREHACNFERPLFPRHDRERGLGYIPLGLTHDIVNIGSNGHLSQMRDHNHLMCLCQIGENGGERHRRRAADACIDLLDGAGLRDPVLDRIGKEMKKRIALRMKGQARVEFIMFTGKYGVLAESAGARELCERLKQQ